MAFETPYFMKSKTTDVGRSNQSVEDRLSRSITELEIKQRKSMIKIEQQMLKVRQDYKLLRADVDFSTDLDEHGKQIDPEACRSKSTGDLPPIHHGDNRRHGPDSAPPRRKNKRKTQNQTKSRTVPSKSKEKVKTKNKKLPVLKQARSHRDIPEDRILSPTSTDYNPVKVEQRYMDFIDHGEKFVKSFEIDKEAKRLYRERLDVSVLNKVVNRANRALALSNEKTIKSLLVTESQSSQRSNIIQIPC